MLTIQKGTEAGEYVAGETRILSFAIAICHDIATPRTPHVGGRSRRYFRFYMTTCFSLNVYLFRLFEVIEVGEGQFHMIILFLFLEGLAGMFSDYYRGIILNFMYHYYVVFRLFSVVLVTSMSFVRCSVKRQYKHICERKKGTWEKCPVAFIQKPNVNLNIYRKFDTI